MTKIKNSFDSIEELKQLDLRRLFKTQKLMLKDLEFWIFKEPNKNIAYEDLINIYAINDIITNKINKVKYYDKN